MNWNPLDWFRKVGRDERREAFAEGLAVSHEEYRAILLEDAIAAKQRGLEATLEAIDYANQLSSSDPAKAAAIAAFKQGVANQARTIRSLMDHPMPEGEGRDEALSVPFDDARSFETSSGNGLPRPTPKALPNGQATPNQETPNSSKNSTLNATPPRRGRGRPRKNPRPDEQGQGTSGPPTEDPPS